MYLEVTKQCWQLSPKYRWNFSDIVDYLQTYLNAEEKDEYKKLEGDYATKMLSNIEEEGKISA